MPIRRIYFHPDAQDEIEHARQWYANRNPIAAHAFLTELEQSLERIIESPERWPKFVADTRRYSLPRFPFSLIYRLQSDVIVIVAVSHHRRKPRYWLIRSDDRV